MKSKLEGNALIEQLRAEAAAFDPAVPAGVRRKVFSALAAAELPAGRNAFAAGVWRMVFGATAVAAAIVLALFWRPAAVTAPSPETIAQTAPSKPAAVIAFATPANPFALAEQYVDSPLEAEFQDLVSRLSDAGRTVRNVLPAPGASKGTRPAGRAPVSGSSTGV